MTYGNQSVLHGDLIDENVLGKLASIDQAFGGSEPLADWEELYLGFDLGTTNMKLVALNEQGQPVTAALYDSRSSIRDGVIVDYIAAIDGMEHCLMTLRERLGVDEFPGVGASAYPPGISRRTAEVCANVVEALGFSCLGLYEEPVVAAVALGLKRGAIIDIGGGTTGIAVISDDEVVYSADEPTGGTHVTLVIAGALGISFDEAERLKRDVNSHKKVFNIVRPVFEKMGLIAKDHLTKSGFLGRVPVVVVGGGANMQGASEVISKVLGVEATLAPYPLVVTPSGIAECLWRRCHGGYCK